MVGGRGVCSGRVSTARVGGGGVSQSYENTVRSYPTSQLNEIRLPHMGWSSVNVSRDALDSWAALYGRPRSLAATRMAVRARERAFQVRMATAKPDVATVATSVI